MADKGIRRYITFILDRASAKKAGAEMEQTLGTAGREGGKDFFRELKAQFARRQAEIKEQLARGLINKREAKKLGEEAGRAYNQGLLQQMDRLRAENKLTDREFTRFSRTLKGVGDAGTSAFGRMRQSLTNLWSGGLAQWIGAGGILYALREANNQANLLDASNRTLAATAKITGVEFEFLAGTAERANEQFGFGVPLANNLTIELTKLSSKAGDLAVTGEALGAFLDIGAARGLDANATLQAVRQAILGIDEGTDKLFGKNPSVLYKEYADKVGLVASKMTDAEKAQALLDAALTDGGKVRGEYSRWLETAAGQQFLLGVRIDEAQAKLGTALQPALAAILPVITGVVKGVGYFIEILQDLGRYITSGALWALSGLVEASAAVAKGYALMIDAAAAAADFFGADDTSAHWRARADAIHAEAKAMRDWAAAAREVARETNAEAGGAFGGRARLPGSTLPPGPNTPTTPTAGTGATGTTPGSERIPTGIQTTTEGVPLVTIGIQTADEIGPIAEEAAAAWRDPWQAALWLIEDDVNNQRGLFGSLVDAWVQGGVRGLARFASAMAKEALANALKSTAKGIAALANPVAAALRGESAAGHFKAAATFTAEAAAWKALGGLGGGSSRSVSAGAGIGAGADVGRSASTNVQVAAPEVHIYVDPLDPSRPAYQKNVYAAHQYATERFGEGAKVYTHPRTGG